MKSTNIGSILYTLSRQLPKNLYLLVLLIAYLILINVQVSEYELVGLEEKDFKVEVKGEVNNPGIYECNLDQSVNDILELAGLLNDADLSAINLSAKVIPEMVIVVPKIKEELKISLNAATLEELEELPGIGEAMALRIIEYRKNNNGFKSIEELMNVKGIGNAKFDKIKDQLSL